MTTFTRPTAWAIIYDTIHRKTIQQYGDIDEAIDAIAAHGYIIVHPDDVPDQSDLGRQAGTDALHHWADGWNACRTAIFGDHA